LSRHKVWPPFNMLSVTKSGLLTLRVVLLPLVLLSVVWVTLTCSHFQPLTKSGLLTLRVVLLPVLLSVVWVTLTCSHFQPLTKSGLLTL
jgi:hypothetical protein